MSKYQTCLVAVLVAATATVASAGPFPTLDISLGIRETGSTNGIGLPGGTAGSIEWVDLGGQTLVLDGTWQLFTFDLDAAPLTGFTGDGILDGAAGTLEHIRIDSNGQAPPMNLWIDDVTNTIDPAGPPPPNPVNFGDFEGLIDGDEYLFQEPSFSGSTSGNVAAGSFSAVDSTMANNGAASYNVSFQFVDNDPSRWVRLTTFSISSIAGGDPTIRFDQDSVVSFWMKGVPEPTSLMLLGLPTLALLRRKR